MAPMAGYSNTSYRKIIKRMGAGLIFAEMVSDKALVYHNQKTFDLLAVSEEERPIAQQIFGSDVDSFVKAAKIVEETHHFDIIDINMGCPVPKVAISSQAGSALLKHPDKIYEIVSSVVKSVSVPVTVKIRLGWDENSINCVEVAKVIEKAGASAITIHARTRAQGYSGIARWEYIKQVKEAVSIPVIGNGDVRSPEDAKRMLMETGCDAVMIGRATYGHPWIFREIRHYLDTGEEMPPMSVNERVVLAKRHFLKSIEVKGERRGLLEMRRHLSCYFKNLFNFKETRMKLVTENDPQKVLELLDYVARTWG